MKNHKSDYPLQKDKDYLSIEKGQFFSDLGGIIFSLQCLSWPPDLKQILNELENECKKRNVKEFQKILEKSRHLAWKYLYSTGERRSELLLVFMSFLSGLFEIKSKINIESTHDV